MYIGLSGDSSVPPGALPVPASSAEVEMQQLILELGAAYRLLQTRLWGSNPGTERSGALDCEVLGGGRYWRMEGELKLIGPGGSATMDGDEDWIDPFVGGRAKLGLTDRLDLSLRGDVGGFGVGSDFTWNAAAAVVYRFSRSASLMGGYRVLDVDYSSGAFGMDMRLHGPFLAFTWSF
jgi:hypothetical protein